jgi:phage baseplate assembly protein W
MTGSSFLGRGWAFPVKPRLYGGGLDMAEGPDLVRQSIRLLLETEPGERLMRPSFGGGLRRYLMKPNTAATRALIQREVELALASWEPRIKTETVEVSPGDDPAMVLIQISYRHLGDGRRDNLVYPFYLE